MLNVWYNLFKILEIKSASDRFWTVWVPCNFVPFQTYDLTFCIHISVWVPCNSPSKTPASRNYAGALFERPTIPFLNQIRRIIYVSKDLNRQTDYSFANQRCYVFIGIVRGAMLAVDAACAILALESPVFCRINAFPLGSIYLCSFVYRQRSMQSYSTACYPCPRSRSNREISERATLSIMWFFVSKPALLLVSTVSLLENHATCNEALLSLFSGYLPFLAGKTIPLEIACVIGSVIAIVLYGIWFKEILAVENQAKK